MNISRSLAALLAALFCCAPISEAIEPDFQPPTIFFVSEPFDTPGPPPSEWQAVLGTWSVAGGTYNSAVGSTTLTTIFEYQALSPGDPNTNVPFDNYRVHARMLNQSTGAGSFVGLVYQYQNPANYYEAIFSPTGTASVRRIVNGNIVLLATAPYQSGHKGSGSTPTWRGVVQQHDGATDQRGAHARLPQSVRHEFISFRVRMLNPYGASGNQVGIVFNYEEASPFNDREYTELVFVPTGVARINQFRAGTVQNIATTAWAARRNAWFDVTFVMNFTAVSVWVDGQQVFDNVETRPGETPSGAVGLITHWAPGRFDDVWFDYSPFNPFTEQFDAGLPAGWSPASGTWSVSAGTLNANSVNATDILVIPNGAETDYTYRARLLNRYGASGNVVGLVYDYQVHTRRQVSRGHHDAHDSAQYLVHRGADPQRNQHAGEGEWRHPVQ